MLHFFLDDLKSNNRFKMCVEKWNHLLAFHKFIDRIERKQPF